VSSTILLYLLVFGLLAALGNFLGGVLVTSSTTAGRTSTKRLLGVGAGFMLATVALEVIPSVAEEWPGQLPTAMAWLLAGYLLIQLAEHAIAPHLHFGEEVHTDEVGRHGVAATAVLGLAIHAFFDGVTIASGLLSSLRLGVFLALAVLIHKLPEGFTVASIVLSSGRSQGTARNATILVAAATFAGIVLVTLFRPLVPYTLPLSAGVTLYVAASDLIPEVNQEGGLSASLFVLSGVALFFAVELVVRAFAGH
jgi:zinc transporter ZupT